MTSEGLGEVFKGDSADMCPGKFPLVSIGGRANGQACGDSEQGAPLLRAEILLQFCYFIQLSHKYHFMSVKKVLNLKYIRI